MKDWRKINYQYSIFDRFRLFSSKMPLQITLQASTTPIIVLITENKQRQQRRKEGFKKTVHFYRLKQDKCTNTWHSSMVFYCLGITLQPDELRIFSYWRKYGRKRSMKLSRATQIA